MTRVAVLLSRIRVEEKLLLTALEAAGADVQVIDDGELVLPLAGPGGLERGNGHLDPATPAGQLPRPTWCWSARSAPPRALRPAPAGTGRHPDRQPLRHRRHLRRQTADHGGAGRGRRAAAPHPRRLHPRVGAGGHRGAGLPGGAQAGGRLLGPAAGADQRPGRGRGGAGAQGDARLLPAQHLLHPGIRRTSRAATSAPSWSATRPSAPSTARPTLDHQHGPRRPGQQLPGDAGDRPTVPAGRAGGGRRRAGDRRARGPRARPAGQRGQPHHGVPQQHRTPPAWTSRRGWSQYVLAVATQRRRSANQPAASNATSTPRLPR